MIPLLPSTSFRTEFTVRPVGYRTPSPPPPEALEPISPLLPYAQIHGPVQGTKKRKLSDIYQNGRTEHSSGRLPSNVLGNTNSLTERDHNGVGRVSQPSALDVFAAVATTPTSDQTNWATHNHISPNRTDPTQQKLGLIPYPRSEERYSKRSRSEQIDYRSIPKSFIRPSTSYVSQGLWTHETNNRANIRYGGNDSHTHIRSEAVYERSQGLTSQDTSIFEAELLLSFARGASQQQQQCQTESFRDNTTNAEIIHRRSSSNNDFKTVHLPDAENHRHNLEGYNVIQLTPYASVDGNSNVKKENLEFFASTPKQSQIAEGSEHLLRPKNSKGWPKGKPRGPRTNNADIKKATKPRNRKKINDAPTTSRPASNRKPSLKAHSLDQTRELPPLLTARRYSDSNLMSISPAEPILRSQSVPPTIPMILIDPSKPSKKLKVNICPTCNMTENPSNGYHDSWIYCNACKEWFHTFCVGFKTEREVKDVDKFHCAACTTIHGPTTYVRKSSRAHASVDYAGLHEGKIRTAVDVPEHHYIKPIKEGKIQFQPETFARMRPELVTADYFEKCGNMSEPILIPAEWNPKPNVPGDGMPNDTPEENENLTDFDQDFEYDCVPDEGQDRLGMVIPQELTVRRVAELYGLDERVEVIDVKSQEGEDKRWTMRKWADYYEAEGEKPVRNVISLEVSQSKLGRLIKRPKVVRDLDLQDSIWPEEERLKGICPKVQFYCLMSVADCYTDFHIDFGGSSVFYHILKGRKTFFFIPPTTKHLKKYEEWCSSPNQNNEFLGDQTKECYRVDLFPGDTMLIPSGWIHAVWTPENSLVIGGNFLTRMHYGMQIQINEIEKNTGVLRKFRYPHFQKVQWYTVLQYLERDPLPSNVAQLLSEGQVFKRETPIYDLFDQAEEDDLSYEFYNARYYSKAELNGLHDLLRYILRTVLISLGRIQGITKGTSEAVVKALPKGYGDHLELAKTFAMWIAWKRGNETIPVWACPGSTISDLDTTIEKKMSTAELKRAERQMTHDALRQKSPRRSSRPTVISTVEPVESPKTEELDAKSSTLGPRRIACEACRKRRIRCKHKEDDEEVSPEQKQHRFGIKQVYTTPPPSPPFADSNGITITKLPQILAPRPALEEPMGAVGTDFEIASTPLPIDNSLPAGKRPRTKACDECRKSKRRCVHDQYGKIDPVKASEASIPRGSSSTKRSRSNDDTAMQSVNKKTKTEYTYDNAIGDFEETSIVDQIPNNPDIIFQTSQTQINQDRAKIEPLSTDVFDPALFAPSDDIVPLYSDQIISRSITSHFVQENSFDNYGNHPSNLQQDVMSEARTTPHEASRPQNELQTEHSERQEQLPTPSDQKTNGSIIPPTIDHFAVQESKSRTPSPHKLVNGIESNNTSASVRSSPFTDVDINSPAITIPHKSNGTNSTDNGLQIDSRIIQNNALSRNTSKSSSKTPEAGPPGAQRVSPFPKSEESREIANDTFKKDLIISNIRTSTSPGAKQPIPKVESMPSEPEDESVVLARALQQEQFSLRRRKS